MPVPALLLVPAALGVASGGYAQNGEAIMPRPTEAQIRWQECELGVIYHLDAPVVAGLPAKNNATRQVVDPSKYNPRELDTDQWIKAARDMGARYAVFTATHFNGFMQWQSDLYPYGLKQAAWREGKGDIVADFVTSCRKHDILPGIYFSTHRNVYNTVWGHYVDWGSGKGSKAQERFNRIAEKQTEELCSRYGKLVQVWYDAGVKLPHEGGPDVLPVFTKHQPDSVFYHSSRRSDHRWIGNEAGHAGYPCWATMPGGDKGDLSHNSASWRKLLHQGDPEGTIWSPAMVDTVLRGKHGHYWFWHPNTEHTIHTVDELMAMYDRSVGRNSNLLLGIVVDKDGRVPVPDVQRMKEFGEELKRRFSNEVAQTKGDGTQLVIELAGDNRTFDHIVLREAIGEGERTRAFKVERFADGRWTELLTGSCIGNKFIDRRPEPVTAEKVRLRITASTAEPRIRSFSLYLSPR